MMYFQPEADEGEGVGAEDVDLPLQRQDVRQGPRGTLPQDVRAPRPRGGAGPCHGALHLLDGFVVVAPTAGHSWSQQAAWSQARIFIQREETLTNIFRLIRIP